MIINQKIPTYGDMSFRDKKCSIEDTESQTVVNQVRKRYPHILFTHIKNEGKRTKAQADFDRSMGMLNGVSDFVFFGNPMLCLELKRSDHTMSHWQPNQQEFLLEAQKQGCMVAVCFGWKGALECVEEWIRIKK